MWAVAELPPTVIIIKPHRSLNTWQALFCASHTSMQLISVKWHRNGCLWDFGLCHVRKQCTSYSHTREGHVVISPQVHGQESSCLPFPQVSIFLHLGEERSPDFHICTGRYANIRKMELGRPGTFIESHQAFLISLWFFAVSQRVWTWMRSEKKGEREWQEGWASENPGLVLDAL